MAQPVRLGLIGGGVRAAGAKSLLQRGKPIADEVMATELPGIRQPLACSQAAQRQYGHQQIAQQQASGNGKRTHTPVPQGWGGDGQASGIA